MAADLRSITYRCNRCNGEGRLPLAKLSPELRGTLKMFSSYWLPMREIMTWFQSTKRTTVLMRVSKLMKLGLVERRTGNNSEPVYRRVK